MRGYFKGLSSPSATLRIMALKFSPRWNSAGQTRFPTFSINRRSRPGEFQAFQGLPDHVAVQVAGPAGVDLHDRRPGPADPLGVVGGLDVSLHHPDLNFAAQQPGSFFPEESFSRRPGSS